MSVTLIPSPERQDLDQLSPQELSCLLEVSRGLGSLLDLEQLLDRVVETSRELLGSEMSTLLLLDESEGLLRVEAQAGLDPAVARRLSTPVGENLAGLVAATGQPLSTVDVLSDDRSRLGSVCRGHIRSALLVPLARNGRVLGVLAVETSQEKCFDEREQGVLRLLADHAAAAIESARLYALEHSQVERLQTLVERIKTQNEAMRRSREAHTRLAEAALEGGGLRNLLGVLVELVPTPIVVANQFGARLADASPVGEERLELLWSECSAATAFGRDLGRLRANAASTRSESGFWRLVPVVAAGEVLGAVVALDHESLTEEHVLILEEAASIVTTELLRERSVAEAEARSHGDLMQALLCAEAPTEGLQERAALLGHDLAAEQAVVAIVPARRGAALPEPSAVISAGRRSVSRVGLRGLFGRVDGNAVVLLSGGDRSLCRDGVERWVADFRQELAARVDAVELHFGVSEIPCDGDSVGDGLAHAREAAAMSRLGTGSEVTYFDDAHLIASLIDITNADSIERFIERTIGRLEEYDLRKRTHLAHTLETYLDCSGVARHAAKALYLHPHSLRYRLRRISEIQGVDLEDPMARLTSHLALKLRGIVGAPA